MIMEMELCKGEIQAYCADISDRSLALIRSALPLKSVSIVLNDVELITHNQEQYNCLDRIIDEAMTNFTNYYYAAGENYSEHPYHNVILNEGEELKDYHKNYFENNPIFKVKYEKLSDTTTKTLFSIKDKDKCIQALDEYCFRYGCDEVVNDEVSLLTCEAQDKQLYNLLTENDYNLNNFVVNDFKYIKALCYNEYLDKLDIVSIDFDFSEENKLICKCIISADKFVKEFRKDATVRDVNTESQKPIKEESANKMVAKLTDIEKQVISARAYLEEHSGKLRVTYNDIADFLTNNRIYSITENNIKQKVSSIYAKLNIQDLGTAVVLLRDANGLTEYNNVKV